MTSRIARIEVIPIFSPASSANDLDGTVETVIVKIIDADGRYGFGEADAAAGVVKSFLDHADGPYVEPQRQRAPGRGGSRRDRGALAEDSMREPSGRAGAGSASTRSRPSTSRSTTSPASSSALPAYKLMGGARREKLRPYCTIYPGPGAWPLDPRPDGARSAGSSTRRWRPASAPSRWRCCSTTWSATASWSASSMRAGGCSATTS